MLYTLTAPFLGRLYLTPDDAGHMKVKRDGIELELRTSRPTVRPGIAVPIDEVAVSTRVPADKLDEFVTEAGQEPAGGVLSEPVGTASATPPRDADVRVWVFLRVRR